MRASLDTNVIIHFYRAGLQNILFDFFDEGVFIYEQIRNIELENHGQEMLDKVDSDIASGKIELYTNQKLKELQVYKIFENNVLENRNLYGSGDLGEVYAISLAQTIGAYSLVTDDTKQGGPYRVVRNAFRMSGIIALFVLVIINRTEALYSTEDTFLAIAEFLASSIIIPVIFEWIYSSRNS